jgi:hypothetical protein
MFPANILFGAYIFHTFPLRFLRPFEIKIIQPTKYVKIEFFSPALPQNYK